MDAAAATLIIRALCEFDEQAGCSNISCFITVFFSAHFIEVFLVFIQADHQQQRHTEKIESLNSIEIKMRTNSPPFLFPIITISWSDENV